MATNVEDCNAILLLQLYENMHLLIASSEIIPDLQALNRQWYDENVNKLKSHNSYEWFGLVVQDDNTWEYDIHDNKSYLRTKPKYGKGYEALAAFLGENAWFMISY